MNYRNEERISRLESTMMSHRNKDFMALFDDSNEEIMRGRAENVGRIMTHIGNSGSPLDQFRVVEDCDVMGDFSDVFDLEVETLVGTDRLLTDTRPPKLLNDMPIQNSLLSVMSLVGIESTCFIQVPTFFAFSRQHKVIHEIGPMCRGDDELEFEFSPVGFEWFTTQFKNSLGILSPREGVVAANTVSNVMYSAKYLPMGSEFMVFCTISLRTNERRYYLWTDTTIVEVNSDGPCYGIYDGGCYNIMWGRAFSMKIQSSAAIRLTPSYYMTQDFLMRADGYRAVLCNINGVDYAIPTQRLVCLTCVSGKMYDANKRELAVDRVVCGNALYEIAPQYKFVAMTGQRADSSKNVNTMRDNVMTLESFRRSFKIPRGLLKIISPMKLVRVENLVGMLLVDSEGGVPYFCRSHGMSKNAAVGRRVEMGITMSWDAYIDVAPGVNVYIGNNGYGPKMMVPVFINRTLTNGRQSFELYNPMKASPGSVVVAIRKTGIVRKDESNFLFVCWRNDFRHHKDVYDKFLVRYVYNHMRRFMESGMMKYAYNASDADFARFYDEQRKRMSKE